MKKIVRLLFLIVFLGKMNGQQFDNSCSSGLKINFLDNSRAGEAFAEHGYDIPYINLFINWEGVKYKGQRLEEIEDLDNLLVPPNDVYNSFKVVIGIERNAPAEYLKRLLCALTQSSIVDINSVYVYFYKRG